MSWTHYKMRLNVLTVKLFLYQSIIHPPLHMIKLFLKNLCSGTKCGGFQLLLILDLWGISSISFHAMVVFGLSKNLLLNIFRTLNMRLWTLLVILPYLFPSKSEKNKYYISRGFHYQREGGFWNCPRGQKVVGTWNVHVCPL